MDLIDLVMQYIRDEKMEKIRETEDYQTAQDQKNESERELVLSMTKKQRRMFHEYIRQREALTAVELSRLLEGCTLVVTGSPLHRPQRRQGEDQTV